VICTCNEEINKFFFNLVIQITKEIVLDEMERGRADEGEGASIEIEGVDEIAQAAVRLVVKPHLARVQPWLAGL
jgi:hypothetical protein